MTESAMEDGLPAGRAQARRRRSWADVLEVHIVWVASLVAIGFAFLRRNEGDITPASGLGYALGILGGVAMLTLLVYPLRKRLPGMRHLGAVRGWFRLHMILGIVGPTLIVLHSNFDIGSLNSLAAMVAMLVVAGSGFIGRFFYARIHRGLFGQKLTLQTAQSDVAELRGLLPVAVGERLGAEMGAYEKHRLDGSRAFFGSWAMAVTGPLSHAIERRKLLKLARQGGPDGAFGRDEALRLRAALSAYFRALARAEAFTVYDRMFAAWHLLHLPLFFILVIAALAHVLAVHMY